MSMEASSSTGAMRTINWGNPTSHLDAPRLTTEQEGKKKATLTAMDVDRVVKAAMVEDFVVFDEFPDEEPQGELDIDSMDTSLKQMKVDQLNNGAIVYEKNTPLRSPMSSTTSSPSRSQPSSAKKTLPGESPLRNITLDIDPASEEAIMAVVNSGRSQESSSTKREALVEEGSTSKKAHLNILKRSASSELVRPPLIEGRIYLKRSNSFDSERPNKYANLDLKRQRDTEVENRPSKKQRNNNGIDSMEDTILRFRGVTIEILANNTQDS